MLISFLNKKGRINGIPEDLYSLKWCLTDKNEKVLIESDWVNKKSAYNSDGWNTISYTQSILKFKDKINYFQIFITDKIILQLLFSIEFSKVINMSYSFVNYINNYNLIVGLCVELEDKFIEFMIDGNVYTRNKIED